MTQKLKCAYCQKVVTFSTKGYPLPHMCGPVKCLGCGMNRTAHEQINAHHAVDPLNPKPKKR